MAAPHERRFTGASPDRIFAACVRAVADRGWKIEHTDAKTRTLSFGTGMSLRTWAGQRMSVFVDTAEDGSVRAVVGARGETLQFYDWGEKGKIARQFFETLNRVLPGVPEPEAQASAPSADEAGSTTAELERLADLHARGSLTDEEFRLAKAKLLGG